MRYNHFNNGYPVDEFVELIVDCFDCTTNDAVGLVLSLEEYYNGEITEVSFNAGEAVRNGKLPYINENNYSGYYGEYHHIAFEDENGERFVERVAFK